MRVAILAIVCLCAQTVHSQQSVEILASGLNQLKDGSFGHAFMIIKTRTRTGVKEDAFGFYPADENATKTQMIIGTPGALKAEWRKPVKEERPAETKRLSSVTTSFEMPITDTQRRAILAEWENWNGKNYEIVGSATLPNYNNCIDFVKTVAEKDLGLPPVDRYVLQTPDMYVGELKRVYKEKLEAERKAREDEERRVREAAQRRAQEEAQRRAQVEAQRRAQEEAERRAKEEAERIPMGWVACHCTSQHSAFGKWVRGTLYHPDNLSCR